MTSPTPVIEGMEVRDVDAEPLGYVQEVSDNVLRVRVQRDIYVPVDAIHAVSTEQIVLTLSVDHGEEEQETRLPCTACGTDLGADTATPTLRKGDARFCAVCWSRLSASRIERVVREVALRGVPLS